MDKREGAAKIAAAEKLLKVGKLDESLKESQAVRAPGRRRPISSYFMWFHRGKPSKTTIFRHFGPRPWPSSAALARMESRSTSQGPEATVLRPSQGLETVEKGHLGPKKRHERHLPRLFFMISWLFLWFS